MILTRICQRNFERKIISAKIMEKTLLPQPTLMQPLQKDLRQGLAKQNQARKTALKYKYPSRSLGAAVPLQPEQAESHNTREVQPATVRHISLMHQFHSVPMNQVAKHARHRSTAPTNKSKVTGKPQFHYRAVRDRYDGKAATP